MSENIILGLADDLRVVCDSAQIDIPAVREWEGKALC